MLPVADDPATPGADDATADQRSRRRSRRWTWAVVGLAAVVIGVISWVGRQSEAEAPTAPKAFCRAADAYERELDRQAERYELDVDRQIRFVTAIVETSPPEILPQATRFLASLEAFRDAPDAAARARLQDEPGTKRAVDAVNRYWNQGCGVFDREGL